MPKYNVHREHEGDRFYTRGDSRVLDAGEAKHLVDLGVLSLDKAEKKPADKSEKASRGKGAAG